MYLFRKITFLFLYLLVNEVTYYEIVTCSWMSYGYMDLCVLHIYWFSKMASLETRV